MTAPAVTPAVRTGGSRSAVGWILLAIVAVVLPVTATATWFHATYTATRPEVEAGVWILKVSLVALALAGLAVPRFALPAYRPSEDPARDSRTAFILAGIVVLAAGLRLYRIDTELWLDEIMVQLRYASLEIRQLLSTFDSQNHQPLYSILANVAHNINGGGDWSIRIPAVIFGVASIWALWSFGRRVTSASEATLGALVLAVSYHHVWFSQNARGYTMMMCLAVIATGILLRIGQGQGKVARLSWGYGILMALAAYTHLTAALIAVGHAIAVVLVTRWRDRESRLIATWCGIALTLSALLTIVLYAPMLPQVVHDVTTPTMEGSEVVWTGAGWMMREGLRVLGAGIPGGLLTVAVALGVLGVGVASYWRQSRFATLLMFLPIAVTLGALVATKHNLWPRFFFFASGFVVLAALRGGFVLVRLVVRWHPERVAIAGACGVAVLSLLTVPRAWEPKQQFRAAAEFIEGQRLPDDEVVALDVAGHVYFMRGWPAGWHSTIHLSMVQEAERSGGRTWIVYTLPARLQAVAPELYNYLAPPRYEVIRVLPASVGGGEIHILRHDPTGQ